MATCMGTSPRMLETSDFCRGSDGGRAPSPVASDVIGDPVAPLVSGPVTGASATREEAGTGAGDLVRCDGGDAPSGESRGHRALKRLALAWARERDLVLAACEVRVPRSPYRADVVAATRGVATGGGTVALFECKQSRADFLRDEADELEVRRTALAAADRLRSLREAIGGHRPDLRRGLGLFPEWDDVDVRGLRHDTLERLEREVQCLQRRLIHRVKFARLHRYGAADHLYLVTSPGILAAGEVPDGWGWLEASSTDSTLHLRVRPQRRTMPAGSGPLWLEAIAWAGARASRRLLER